jgi:hypothetical protein
MGDGTLPVENFKVYLVQDYLFLVGLAPWDNWNLVLIHTEDTILPSERFGRLQG